MDSLREQDCNWEDKGSSETGDDVTISGIIVSFTTVAGAPDDGPQKVRVARIRLRPAFMRAGHEDAAVDYAEVPVYLLNGTPRVRLWGAKRREAKRERLLVGARVEGKIHIRQDGIPNSDRIAHHA